MLAALLRACRDTLREDLIDFYDNDDPTTQENRRKLNCKVMVDERPVPNCGEEFISLFGAHHRAREVWHQTAIEEEYGIVIAVTHKVAKSPFHHRGETSYILDDDEFIVSWMSLEQRCREIVGLLDKNYTLLRSAEAMFNHANAYSEPLVWVSTDAVPQAVGAEHFSAFHTAVDTHGQLPGEPEADDTYGFMMRIHFDRAIRFQPKGEYDTAP